MLQQPSNDQELEVSGTSESRELEWSWKDDGLEVVYGEATPGM